MHSDVPATLTSNPGTSMSSLATRACTTQSAFGNTRKSVKNANTPSLLAGTQRIQSKIAEKSENATAYAPEPFERIIEEQRLLQESFQSNGVQTTNNIDHELIRSYQDRLIRKCNSACQSQCSVNFDELDGGRNV